MPYIDSGLYVPILASLFFVAWVSFCGAALVRLWCGIREWTFLPPLGMAVGCAVFLVSANLVSKVGAVPDGSRLDSLIDSFGTAALAFSAAFVLVSGLGIYALIRQLTHAWPAPSRHSLLTAAAYTLFALVVAYVCLAVRNHAYFYDFPTHLAFAITIAHDNLPVRNPYAPALPSGYHYGAAFLTAALSRASSLPAVTGYQLLAFLQGTALLLLVFALGRQAGRHALWGLACVIGTIALGNIVIWWPLADSNSQILELLRGDLSRKALLAFPSLSNHVDLAYPFRSFSTDLRWLLIYPHRIAGLVTIVALAVMLTWPGKPRHSLGMYGLAICLAAAAALYDETMMPLALMALAWPIVYSFRARRQMLFWLGTLLAAIVTIVFQGGSITDALLGTTGSRPSMDLRSPAEIASSILLFKEVPGGWLWILPPLPLVAGTAFAVWKRWWLGLILCGYGFAAYIGFHTLKFGEVAGAGELARVVNLTFLSLALLVPLAGALLLRDAPRRRTALVALALLPLLVPTFLQPATSIALDLGKRVELRDPRLPGLVYTPEITDPAVTLQLHAYRQIYEDIARALPEDSVVLTQFPVSFVIATGIPVAFAPTEGVSLFPTHIYIPGPAYYDAFWRLDPDAWREHGATAVLYYRRSFDSLPHQTREVLETNGWFNRTYESHDFVLFSATSAFLEGDPPPVDTHTALSGLLSSSETVHLSNDLPFGIGQALVRQLNEQPVAGLRPDNRAHLWISVNRPADLTEANAAWHVRRDEAARRSGYLPEGALWHWRAPGENVGVYPNDLVPAFSASRITAGQSFSLQASRNSLAIGEGGSIASASEFSSLTLLFAGHAGSVVQLCSPSGCAERDLGGHVWTFILPVGESSSQVSFTVLHGQAYVAGTLGYGEQSRSIRSPGVVLQSRQAEDSIEVDASYFNYQGWTYGDGTAWHLVKVEDGMEVGVDWWASQLLINGERGDVRLTLDQSGEISETNFTTDPTQSRLEPLTEGEYLLYLAFTVEPYGVPDRIPAARFTVREGAIATFTPLPQIARLSFGPEHVEPLVLD